MIRNLTYIARFFRGAAGTLPELLNMDIGFIATLNKMASDESKDKQKMEANAAQDVEDALTGG